MLLSTTRRRPLTPFQSRFTQTPRAPRAPPWRPSRGGTTAAGAADANADATPQSLSTLLSPLIAQATSPKPLPAAIFWDADNVRPSSGSGGNSSNDKKDRSRRAAVRQTLAALTSELERAGCRVDACAAYGNAATLGEEDDDDSNLYRIVITTTSKRQSADMALLSDLCAFVRSAAPPPPPPPTPQQQQPPQKAPPSCLILLIADDAGYAQPCAWASSEANKAAIIACGASAAKRAPYALPTSPLEPWRFHPVAKAGAAAVVVPWVVVVGGDDAEEDDGSLSNLDVGAAWVNPEGVFFGGG